jgi:chromosome segregation ATPase
MDNSDKILNILVNMQGQMGIMQNQINTMQGDTATIPGDMNILKNHMSTMQSQLDRQGKTLEDVKGDVSVLKGDVSVLKGDVSTLKGDVSDVKQGQARTNTVLEILGERQQDIQEQMATKADIMDLRSNLTKKVKNHEKRLITIEDELDLPHPNKN